MDQFNCSRNISTNETMEFVEKHIPITPSTIGYALAGITLVWISSIYIIYLVYYIIKYIQEKPPNLQTMLDGFYVQLFVSWIITAAMAMILELLLELGTLNVKNEIVTEIVAWLFYASVLFMSVSIGTSCVARILLIALPNLVEQLDDMITWLFNG